MDRIHKAGGGNQWKVLTNSLESGGKPLHWLRGYLRLEFWLSPSAFTHLRSELIEFDYIIHVYFFATKYVESIELCFRLTNNNNFK
jgi:hypothetical protein